MTHDVASRIFIDRNTLFRGTYSDSDHLHSIISWMTCYAVRGGTRGYIGYQDGNQSRSFPLWLAHIFKFISLVIAFRIVKQQLTHFRRVPDRGFPDPDQCCRDTPKI